MKSFFIELNFFDITSENERTRVSVRKSHAFMMKYPLRAIAVVREISHVNEINSC